MVASSVVPARRVLVVEDDLDTQQCYQMMLSHEGYDVFVASDGGTGLEIALTELPDLVVTDINLPVLSGWEIARALKARPDARAIPLIAISAGDAWQNRETAMALGFERYLEKPCTPSRLLGEVAEALGLSGTSREPRAASLAARPLPRRSSSGSPPQQKASRGIR
jgi:CheY-like chemotaxis protein